MPVSATELAEAQRVSGAALLERGERLLPGLVERQAEAERLRHLPEITMAKFHEAASSGSFSRSFSAASR